MARTSGPFAATEGDMGRAREYLAERGITYRGHSPAQAQRLANGVARQEAAGLIANRAAARGHGSTPEHPGRAVPRTFRPPAAERQAQPAAAGKELKVGRPSDYARVHQRPHNEVQQFNDGQRIYQGSERFAVEGIKDAAFQGGRVDVEVTYADGTKQRLFTGSDHKRNGEHAIDAKVLQQMIDDADGDFDAVIDDVAEDSGSEIEPEGSGGIISYSIHAYI